MLRSACVIIAIVALGLLGWWCRAIWAVDPLAAPAGNGGWGLTATASNSSDLETATFAAGCFWGVESTFRKVPGVIRTRVGYTGGTSIDPTYLDVASRKSGHAEAIDIEFDPKKVSFQELLKAFFNSHDPTADGLNEYRSAVFYHSPGQQQSAEAEKLLLDQSGDYKLPIATEIVAATTFYPAEEYHQRYYESRGSNHVCTLGNGKKPGR